MVPLTESQTDPFSHAVAKLILGDIDDLTPPPQTNRLHGRLLAALVKQDKVDCQRILLEMNERDLNRENDEWTYNDFTLLLALAASIKFELDTKSLERISSYRLKQDESDLTASELKSSISNKLILNPLSICARAIAGTSQPCEGLQQSYLSVHRENNRSSLSPFRAFITRYAIIHLNAETGAATLKKNANLEKFIETGAIRVTREAKFVHIGTIIAAVGWLVFLSIKHFQGDKEWKELLGWVSLVGASAPIALICSMIWKRNAFLDWYVNFKFKLFGGTKYNDLNGQ